METRAESDLVSLPCAGKESSLLRAAEELEQKVLKLDGLEEKVAEIRANIQKAVHFHSNCL